MLLLAHSQEIAWSVTLILCCWEWLSANESLISAIRNIVISVAAMVALPLAIWRSVVAARQVKTAQRSLLNERYQRGAEMLGSEVLSVRVGGIYALARLAREYPGDYHTQIMRLLCAFVRTPPPSKKPPREDVQAVMIVLFERSMENEQIKLERKESYCLDLTGADLSYANLHSPNQKAQSLEVLGFGLLIGVDLDHAILIDTKLNSAVLPLAKLNYANLTQADLSRAVLSGAELTDSNLTRVNLDRADLSGATGLTQEQLDRAVAHSSLPPDPAEPPTLTAAIDAETGKPLVWKQ